MLRVITRKAVYVDRRKKRPGGVDGVDGIDGVDGVDGIDGVMGPAGPMGPMGPVGPVGPMGLMGLMGPVGPAIKLYSTEEAQIVGPLYQLILDGNNRIFYVPKG